MIGIEAVGVFAPRPLGSAHARCCFRRDRDWALRDHEPDPNHRRVREDACHPRKPRRPLAVGVNGRVGGAGVCRPRSMGSIHGNDRGGDVALYWLPHIERLRERLPNLRVISLRRERTATVDSLTRKCPGYTLVRPQDRHHNPEWWDLTPSIDAPSIAEAWSRYYDYNYEQVSALSGVLHVATEALDQDDTLRKIFDFLEIPDADRVLLPERRHNTGSETVVAFSRTAG